MARDSSSTNEASLGDTVRIDRRNTILAQVEAALLSDKLDIPGAERKAGGDPYNSGRSKATDSVWKGRAR